MTWMVCFGGLAKLGEVPALLLLGPSDPIFCSTFLAIWNTGCRRPTCAGSPARRTSVTEDEPEVAERAWSWIRTRVCRNTTAHPRACTRLPIDIAAAEGSATAIAEPGRDHARLTTFDALTARGVDTCCAGTLRGAGVQPGHRVALLVPPGLELRRRCTPAGAPGAAIVILRRHRAGLAPDSQGVAQRRPGPSGRVPSSNRGRCGTGITWRTHRCRRPAKAGPSRLRDA